ncbi:hypothetical protein VMCG_07015 [Cytospora schulzeri]|uniref:Calcium channel YVC1-like C-terminal transmembrane domain-containing protein n=1 Tax=Cytospora schulzeri TaxID=448051 RepID=A0A423W417_9PEZI|nr:hypothetical protein VMCG_07015 [Valsa malicola]
MASDDKPLTALGMPEVPTIRDDESFAELSKKLALYIIEAVDSPLSWEDLRSSKHLKALQPLINYLSKDCHHTAVVAALVALKGHFKAIESDDNCDINEARGFACELVAWQFVLTLSDQEALDYLLFELREDDEDKDQDDEETGLLSGLRNGHASPSRPANGHQNGNGGAANSDDDKPNKGEGFSEPFMNLNTLEIATVSGAKKFLSQRAVQEIIDSIWYGDIVFWDRLTVNAVKKPRFHGKRVSDPWCRLRVPRYMKTFEILFFICFLALFYTVSLQRVKYHVTIWEILFYVFTIGFAFDEMDDFVESGAYFYSADIWSLWDIGILLIGVTFFVLRMIGLGTGHEETTEWAFSILALHSLLLTPRIFSLLSLSPYYGSLLPCLKEMGKQFIRFLGFTLIIYLGFFSTFILLARGHFPLDALSITVLKVFFGAGVVGFDIAPKVSPYLGLPVMIIFVCLTNQLLITSMMAHISNSLRQVLDSSREEYLYVYSVYVLEAVTSDKLTYFQPPFNLIPIVLFRPLLFFTPEKTARQIRILLLKGTHAPLIGAIWMYERWEVLALRREAAERAALSFGFDTISTRTKPAQPKPINGKTDNRQSSKKHTLKNSRKVQVPAALLSKASKRTSKQAGTEQESRGRVNTAPAIVEEDPTPGNVAGPEPATPVPLSAVSAPGETIPATTEALPASDVATMMRMLKELSTQVEEVRAALVKHESGAME